MIIKLPYKIKQIKDSSLQERFSEHYEQLLEQWQAFEVFKNKSQTLISEIKKYKLDDTINSVMYETNKSLQVLQQCDDELQALENQIEADDEFLEIEQEIEKNLVRINEYLEKCQADVFKDKNMRRLVLRDCLTDYYYTIPEKIKKVKDSSKLLKDKYADLIRKYTQIHLYLKNILRAISESINEHKIQLERKTLIFSENLKKHFEEIGEVYVDKAPKEAENDIIIDSMWQVLNAQQNKLIRTKKQYLQKSLDSIANELVDFESGPLKSYEEIQKIQLSLNNIESEVLEQKKHHVASCNEKLKQLVAENDKNYHQIKLLQKAFELTDDDVGAQYIKYGQDDNQRGDFFEEDELVMAPLKAYAEHEYMKDDADYYEEVMAGLEGRDYQSINEPRHYSLVFHHELRDVSNYDEVFQRLNVFINKRYHAYFESEDYIGFKASCDAIIEKYRQRYLDVNLPYSINEEQKIFKNTIADIYAELEARDVKRKRAVEELLKIAMAYYDLLVKWVEEKYFIDYYNPALHQPVKNIINKHMGAVVVALQEANHQIDAYREHFKPEAVDKPLPDSIPEAITKNFVKDYNPNKLKQTNQSVREGVKYCLSLAKRNKQHKQFDLVAPFEKPQETSFLDKHGTPLAITGILIWGAVLLAGLTVAFHLGGLMPLVAVAAIYSSVTLPVVSLLIAGKITLKKKQKKQRLAHLIAQHHEPALQADDQWVAFPGFENINDFKQKIPKKLEVKHELQLPKMPDTPRGMPIL